MSLFDTYLKVDYRQLLPNGSNDDVENAAPESLGIYEDDESRAERSAREEFQCPAWCDALPSLSFRERLLGCVTCMVCGYILGFGSLVRIKELLFGNPVPLVVNVTLGNILALCGTCFLTGPQQQSRRMFHKSRRIASVMYLGCLGVTVFLLLLPRFPTRGLMLFLLLVAQYAAILWYCLSYIPFARDFLKRCCRNMFQGEDDA